MKALIVLSGGQDSSTCLAHAIDSAVFDEVRAVTFDYGQRHSREIDCAREMINWLAKEHGVFIHHEIITVPDVLKGTSPLVNKKVEVESYASPDVLPGGLEKTFVPMRNALFLTLAANRAAVWAAETGESVAVVTGVSQEDYGGYPDCRSAFIGAAQLMISQALDDPAFPKVLISTPLIHATKAATVKMAEDLPYGRALNALSHTCYNGKSPPCGTCHACLLREKGYTEAGVRDPLLERLEEQHSHA